MSFRSAAESAAKNIKGEILRNFFLFALIFIVRLLFAVCLFCAGFSSVYKPYPIYVPAVFALFCVAAFLLFERLKMAADIRFMFSGMRPVHLRKPGVKVFFKYVAVRILSFILRFVVRALFLLPGAVPCAVIFFKAADGETLVSVFILTLCYSFIMLAAGLAAGGKICCRYSLCGYYILRLRDSGIFESIKQSVYTMDGHCSAAARINAGCFRYSAAEILIFPAVYCSVMKNAVKYQLLNDILTFGHKEKAITFYV